MQILSVHPFKNKITLLIQYPISENEQKDIYDIIYKYDGSITQEAKTPYATVVEFYIVFPDSENAKNAARELKEYI